MTLWQEISEFHYHQCCHYITFVDFHDDHAGKSSSEGVSGDPFLLACRFFDRECAGHLDADDLEEIVFMVSDSISREPPHSLLLACADHTVVISTAPATG